MGQSASSRADNDRLFRAAAELYSIDPDLLAAIATVESGNNSGAVSPKGAQGLMQLMPATANRFRVHDPFDPVSNTLGAVRFINFLRQYRVAGGDGAPLSLPEMLAAYNAGEGAVDKYGGVPPYPETQLYVRKVLVAYLFGNSHSPLAQRLGAELPNAYDLPVAAGIAAILGHVFPVWLGFRGGKGVASGLGVFLALSPAAAGCAFAIFLVIFLITRYVSLASIVGSAFFPFFGFYFVPVRTPIVIAGFLFIPILVIFKHHENIRRLLAGTENRFGKKKGGR